MVLRLSLEELPMAPLSFLALLYLYYRPTSQLKLSGASKSCSEVMILIQTVPKWTLLPGISSQ